MKSKLLFCLIAIFIFNIPKVEALRPYEILSRKECPIIELAEAKEDGSLVKIECYDTYQTAKDMMNSTENDNLVLIENGMIIDSKYAVIDYDVDLKKSTNGYISVFVSKDSNTTNGYYINNGATPDDAALIEVDYNTKRVKIKVAGLTGWINKYDGDLILYDIVPLIWVKSPQHYTVTTTELKHIFPGNVYGNDGGSLTIDQKPSMLDVGTYYSYDGHYFYKDMKTLLIDYKNGNYNQSVNKDNPYYNYYQYLSFRTKTSYSSENINEYLLNGRVGSNSKMLNTGEYFINAQNNYGINAIIMMAIGMNESGRGTSKIALEKNNLFGLNAIDKTPGQSANYFASVADCIETYAYSWLSYGYVDSQDSRFKGANLGNKIQGLNYKYASDPFWAEKAASFYYDLDKLYSFQDYNTYQLAVLNNDYNGLVYAKKTPGGANINSSHYQYKVKDSSIVILDEVEGPAVNGNKIWYKIQSDPTLDANQNYIDYQNVRPGVTYNFDKSYAYVPSVYFNKINKAVINDNNQGNNPDIPNGGGNTVTPVPTPTTKPVPTPTPTPTPVPTPVPTPIPTPTPIPVKKVSDIVEDAKYKYSNGTISGISPNTSVEVVKNNLAKAGGTVTITDASGKTKTNGNIGTGDKVKITSGNINEELKVLIYGDINGDGSISAVDYVKVKNHIMGSSPLSDVYVKSADVNSDDKISAVDYVNIKNYIMGADNVIKN